MQVVVIDEAFTSQTCPWTGQRRKPRGRHFVSPCGQHRMDRDGGRRGEYQSEVSGDPGGQGDSLWPNPSLPWTPVLVGMAPTTWGQRFRPQVSHAQSRRGAVYKTARIPGL
ncbi:zinc ribbon domain-containing protein [Deinococcus caeni]|uniref:zinc ribbon domain-containing protein n=1 Tax=Deinococcus caeni TaxID=569127 RepID=UPI00361C0450